METFDFPLFLLRRNETIFKELLTNEQISGDQVRLIAEDGEQLGIVNRRDALSMAEQKGLDLVLLNGNSSPSVCKLMNYGKYKFEQIKKEKELKKNQKIVELKEIQLSMTIDQHDIEVKAKHGNRFLQDGNKIKVVLRMRGRQQAYAKNAVEVVNKFFTLLEENGTIDKIPEVVGRNVIMIVSPKKQ